MSSIAVLRRVIFPSQFAFVAWAAVLAAIAAVTASSAGAQPRPLDVPYVPTPQVVVDKMLEMAQVGPNDYLIDLGCGDGRIPVTAAMRFGTRGFGVDLNPQRVKEAIANAKEAKVTDKVSFVEGDLFKTDFSQATVLTLYLLPSVNLRLRPTILKELKPGTRVVSHAFNMGDWEADKEEVVDHKTVYFWIVPAQVEGKWQVADSRPEAQSFTVAFNQKFQELSGSAVIDGKSVPMSKGRLEGDRISFEIAVGGQNRRFEGRVEGGRIEGQGWKASKG